MRCSSSSLIVIPSERSLRSEGSGRAARRVAFLATKIIARLGFLAKLYHYSGSMSLNKFAFLAPYSPADLRQK